MKLLSVATFFVEEMQNHQFDGNFRKLREILLARPRKLYLLKKKPQILRSFYDLPHIDNNSIGEVVPLITNRSINPIDIRMRRRASHPMANSIQQSAFVSPLYKQIQVDTHLHSRCFFLGIDVIGNSIWIHFPVVYSGNWKYTGYWLSLMENVPYS